MQGNIDRETKKYFILILENNKEIKLKKENYLNLKVGHVVKVEGNQITPDLAATAALKQKNIDLQNQLFKS